MTGRSCKRSLRDLGETEGTLASRVDALRSLTWISINTYSSRLETIINKVGMSKIAAGVTQIEGEEKAKAYRRDREQATFGSGM